MHQGTHYADRKRSNVDTEQGCSMAQSRSSVVRTEHRAALQSSIARPNAKVVGTPLQEGQRRVEPPGSRDFDFLDASSIPYAPLNLVTGREPPIRKLGVVPCLPEKGVAPPGPTRPKRLNPVFRHQSCDRGFEVKTYWVRSK